MLPRHGAGNDVHIDGGLAGRSSVDLGLRRCSRAGSGSNVRLPSRCLDDPVPLRPTLSRTPSPDGARVALGDFRALACSVKFAS